LLKAGTMYRRMAVVIAIACVFGLCPVDHVLADGVLGGILFDSVDFTNPRNDLAGADDPVANAVFDIDDFQTSGIRSQPGHKDVKRLPDKTDQPRSSLQERTYYVANNGSDSNPGTQDQPFRTLEKAVEVVQTGQTIFIRGGTYLLSQTIAINKHGARQKYINLWAYRGQSPVLDFSGAGVSSHGFKINGSFWHVKGLTITKAGDKGIHIEGSNNIVEQTITHSNGDGGIKIDTGACNNLVLNCDSYLNYDKATKGKNADGFAAKHGLGKGNRFIGCRAWNNSDDGFDFMEAGKAVHVENCWSWGNGQNIWKDPGFDGNGVGYKLGDGPGEHVVIRSLVWANAKCGFNIQGNTSCVNLYNNTAWNNGRDYFFDDNHPHKLRNNVSFQGRVVMWKGIDHKNNSWNGGVTVTPEDFLSLDDTDMKNARQPDGGLPDTDFLKPAPSSDLIDAGINVGLAFQGRGPDLGAFETTEKSGAIP
ncbi:MAG: right-handed parallel beta-helix repeat-containing protein, partial [Planctomycetota bacterium]